MEVKKYIFTTIFLTAIPLVTDFSSFEGIKIIWFFTGSLLLIALYTFRKQKLLFNHADFFFMLWIVLLTISSILGIHPIDSVLGNSYRHQGVLFFLLIWCVFFLIRNIYNKRDIILLQSFVMFVGILQVFIVLYQIIFRVNVFNYRPLGTLGEPNALAGYLSLVSIFVLFSNKKRYKHLVNIFLFLGVLLTSSKTGIIVFLIIYFLYLINKIRVKRYKYFATVLLIISMLMSILITIKVYPNLFYEGKYENRPLLWSMALKASSHRLLIGYGAESTQTIYELSFIKEEMPLLNLNIDRTHNIFLDILLWSGLLGLATFLLWIGFSYKDLVGKDNFIGIACLTSFIIFASFHPVGVTHWTMLIIALINKKNN